MTSPSPSPRLRREPPRFRIVSLLRREPITPRLVRCTFGGDDLVGFPQPDPAASVRVLFPAPGTTELVMPEWNGNEFLMPGSGGGIRLRPYLRTFTPLDPGRVPRLGPAENTYSRRHPDTRWFARLRPPCFPSPNEG